MRVVIATPLYPPESGGPATYSKLLEEGLSAQGIEATVVAFSGVRHLPKFLSHFVYLKRIARALKEADAVLALDPVSVGYPAMLAAKQAKKPLYLKVVGDYAWEQGRQRFGITSTLDEFVRTTHVPGAVRFLRKRQEAVARSATRIIVPSLYLKRIVSAWGIEEEKITVIHNAVTLESGGATYPAVSALPAPRIVSVSRLVPWKGMAGVIEAVRMVRARGVSASLIIAGDGPERAKLEALAREQLREGYLFLGEISHADTLSLIQGATVFVLNTSYEGLSHLLIEAKLLGKPIVTTPVGGNVELTKDGVDALWVSPTDSAQLADALVRLTSDTAFAEQLGKNAKASAEQEFNTERLLKETAVFLTKAS